MSQQRQIGGGQALFLGGRKGRTKSPSANGWRVFSNFGGCSLPRGRRSAEVRSQSQSQSRNRPFSGRRSSNFGGTPPKFAEVRRSSPRMSPLVVAS